VPTGRSRRKRPATAQARAKSVHARPAAVRVGANRTRFGRGLDWLGTALNETAMEKTAFLDELQAKLESLLANTPAADLQKNLKALLAQQFARLDLVTREEFDTQAKVLARTREKLEALEARLAELENKPR
jgi:BMFP domain-containing protein YqiC